MFPMKAHMHTCTHTLAETCPDAGAAEGCEAVHTDDKGSVGLWECGD